MKMLTLFAVLFLTAAGAVHAQQVTSVYTKLSEKACKTLELVEDEGALYRGSCPGVGGYKLELIEGDLRQTLTIIDPKRKEHPLEFWHLTGAFTYIGETAEWRMKGKKPIALIVRLNVSENVEDASKTKGYLVVAKITASEVCVTHFLAPTRSHNYEARKAADKASTRPCLKRASD